MRSIPGTTIIDKPMSTPMDSGKLLPKLGYLKNDTTPSRIKIDPIIVFI